MAYNWKSDKTRMLRALRASRTQKEKANWTRETGAGFIQADIKNMQLINKQINFTFSWGSQTIAVCDLNLRETEESIKFLEPKKEYVVKGYYGKENGWEVVYTGTNKKDALDRLKEYRENEPNIMHKLSVVYEED